MMRSVLYHYFGLHNSPRTSSRTCFFPENNSKVAQSIESYIGLSYQF